ncbi:MAG: acyl-ACP--UDP-N-acetylglucosamine O-acyltransferase [Halanaerobiales bacterium]
MFIHRTAIIASGARLGKGVKVGPFTVIGENVEIGDGTEIGAFAHLEGWTIIGKNNIIKDHVSIGQAPQYLGYGNEKTHVVIGNNNTIGEFVTIHRGTIDGLGETRIGHNNSIMSHCHIAHDCNLGNNIFMGSSTNLAGHVNIENDAWLEELVGVHQFVNVGKLSLVEFKSKVTKDVPPYIMVNGHPARVEGLNYKGMKRHGLETATIDEIVRAFNILYNSGMNISEAVQQMDQELLASKEVEEFIRFIKKSTRGICR